MTEKQIYDELMARPDLKLLFETFFSLPEEKQQEMAIKLTDMLRRENQKMVYRKDNDGMQKIAVKVVKVNKAEDVRVRIYPSDN